MMKATMKLSPLDTFDLEGERVAFVYWVGPRYSLFGAFHQHALVRHADDTTSTCVLNLAGSRKMVV